MKTYFVGGTVFTPDEVIEGGTVITDGRRILDVCASSSLPLSDGELVDVTGLNVTPGFIDLHLHGLEGFDLMAGGGSDVAARVVRSGVTSFLATVLAAPLDELKSIVRTIALDRSSQGAELLGIHLEGPYLSACQPGMMDPSHFRPFDWDEMQELVEAGGGLIRMVTLAPELQGSLQGIDQLERAGIVASVGHSNATFAEMKKAADAGLRHATHVFNAMRGFHHREPGVVGAVLHCPDIVAQLIVDGEHLHPASVDLLLKLKGVDALALISDATPLAGLSSGQYRWRGMDLEVGESRVEVKPGGGLGGSIRMVNHGLRLLVQGDNLPIGEALKTVTTTPARVLGLGHMKGRLAPGWDADISVFDDRFECRLAMVGGNIAYRSDATR